MQVFSSEFYKFFGNAFFAEPLRSIASSQCLNKFLNVWSSFISFFINWNEVPCLANKVLTEFWSF